jgi:hypothetical protein
MRPKPLVLAFVSEEQVFLRPIVEPGDALSEPNQKALHTAGYPGEHAGVEDHPKSRLG